MKFCNLFRFIHPLYTLHSCARSPFSTNNIKAYKETRKIVENNKYEIVHLHSPIGGFCGRIACKKLRKNGTKVSVELAVNEMSFNATSKVLELTDVVILGATLLGKDPETLKDVGEGMKNARLDIADFSTKNNSVFTDYENQMIEFQERLEKLETACFNKDQNLGQNNEKEGGNETNMNKFEELLAKYGKTAEDIKFDYAELSSGYTFGVIATKSNSVHNKFEFCIFMQFRQAPTYAEFLKFAVPHL